MAEHRIGSCKKPLYHSMADHLDKVMKMKDHSTKYESVFKLRSNVKGVETNAPKNVNKSRHIEINTARFRSTRQRSRSTKYLACVASVSVWFRSKERPRNGILGFGRARTALLLAPFFARSFFASKPNGNACYAG